MAGLLTWHLFTQVKLLNDANYVILIHVFRKFVSK